MHKWAPECEARCMRRFAILGFLLSACGANSTPPTQTPPSSDALVALVRGAAFDVAACRGMPDAPTLGAQYAAQVRMLGLPIHEGGRCVPPTEGPIDASEDAVWSCTVIATPADEHGGPLDEASNFSVVFELDAQGAIIETSPLCIAAG